MRETGMQAAESAMRVLAVDDDAASLKLLAQILTMSGYPPPVLVSDPRGLRQVCMAQQFDVILLDIQMPHLDGWQAMQLFAECYGPGGPPVIVLTAEARRSVQLRALSDGACDFVTKPFDVGDLLLRLRKHATAHRSSRTLNDRKDELEVIVQQRTQEVRQSRLEILQLLGRAAEFRDNETGAHILRMSHASALLARRIGWRDSDCELMLNASPLHDVGKIAIPDSILLKPGPLTAEEREIMQTHTVKGAAILRSSDNEMILMAAEIALAHHEKWDGSGYPYGLSAEGIPESARIVAVADVFDALTSQRPYKAAWPVDRSLEFIRQQSGLHFDPMVVEALFTSVDDVLGIRQRFVDQSMQSVA